MDLDGLQQSHKHPGPDEKQVVAQEHNANDEPCAKDWRREREVSKTCLGLQGRGR